MVSSVLTWNVYYYDMCDKEIEVYNIFDHSRFNKAVREIFETSEYIEDFAVRVKDELMYYFWSKAEWEVIVAPWPNKGNDELKVDVYSQVMNNFDSFIGYTWRALNKDKDMIEEYELIEWLHNRFGSMQCEWDSWFEWEYCNNCEKVIEYVESHEDPNFEVPMTCNYCEYHDKCRYFPNVYVYGEEFEKMIIRLWYEKFGLRKERKDNDDGKDKDFAL